MLLSACGGGGGGGPVGANPGGPATTMGPSTLAVGYDNGTSLFGFSANGAPLADLARDAARDNGRFDGYANAGTNRLAFGAQTANAIVGVAASDSDAVADFGGVAFQRLTATTLPGSGVAVYNGDYVGFFRNETTPNSDISRSIRGDAMLTADFNANTIAGNITNRELLFRTTNNLDASNPMADLTLQSTAINSAGRFSGSTSGGEVTVNSWDPTNGVFQGVIAGPNGGIAVGGVVVNHESSSNVPFQEIGGFYAN